MSFPEQPFGFVAGRWVRSIGDTPDDADRAPDYVPVETGTVLFTPQVTHRVAADATGWAGIIKERIPARLGERGQLIDAEGHDHLALAAGIYSVSYDFGSGRSWPSHYIEVRTDHTASAPLWLPPIAPPPVGPMIENRVVTIPEGGADGQVLVWDGAGFSWADPPKGDKGDTGDLEFMSGTTRIVNMARGREHEVSGYSNAYMQPPIPMAEGDIIYTHRVYSNSEGPDHGVIGSIVIIAGETIHTRLVGGWRTPTLEKFDKSRRVEIASPVPENAYLAIYGENPAAPALFSDINIINLTQVFGAGNEPSLEYMDALVEKHGGYIDGEQYAVGDALRALTVTGPGMSLRHDNSVGERVLLDHPGGSTMIYGDTGWRTITSWDTEGNMTGETLTSRVQPKSGRAGSFSIRRIGSRVYVALIGYTLTDRATFNTSIPVGFRPVGDSEIVPFMINDDGTRGWSRLTGWGFYLEADSYPVDSSHFAPSVIEFDARDSWPTTLPGTPF